MQDDRWWIDSGMRREITNRGAFAAASRQAGRLSREQLGWLDWSAHRIDRCVGSGLLTPRLPGVYAVGPVLLSHLATAWEAALTVGGAGALTGVWGCWRHGMLGAPFGSVDVATTAQTGRALRGIVVRRRAQLLERDVVIADGLRLLSPAECLLDLACHHPKLLPKALNEAQRLLLDVGDVRSLARGRPGAVHLRAALDAYDPREQHTREELERRALTMLVTHGAPVYEPNAAVEAGGRTYYVDGLYREACVVVELQSEAHHSTPAERRADRHRLNDLQRAGLAVLQWDWWDVTRDARPTVAGLTSLLGPTTSTPDRRP